MKKELYLKSLLLTAILLIGSLNAFAQDFVDDNGIGYNIIGSELTVTSSYTQYEGTVNIPSSVYVYDYNSYLDVTAIGESAFSGCTELLNVTIPNTVRAIENNAFSGCSGLTSISIPNSVTYIGDYAFYNSGLTSVTIPNSITEINNSTFERSSLTSVNIPNSVTYIGERAFYMSRLHSVYIPNSVTCIDAQAFCGCTNLTNLSIGQSVTSIGLYAFQACINLALLSWNAKNCPSNGNMSTYSIEAVAIGPNVKVLPNAFLHNAKITEINIPNSVNAISDSAFMDCKNLSNVTIPSSITSIGTHAFKRCIGLTNISIPNSIISIGKEAFLGCTALKSVTIPNSVTSVGNYAFQNCSALDTLNFYAINCSNFSSSSQYTPFYGLNLSILNIGNNVERIPAYFAYGLTNLTNVAVPNSVKSIGEYAFYGCSGMTNLIIGNSVETIGNYAFRNCSSLSEIISHPITPPALYQYSFYGDYSAALYVHKSAMSAYLTANYWKNFSSINTLETIEFSDSTVEAICLANWDLNGDGKLSFSEAEAVTNLNNAFRGDSTITSFNELQYFTGLTSLGSFENCINLESIVLPETITSIGGSFKNCSSLRYLRIPSSVTNIYFTAFENCPLDLEIADGSVNYMSDNGAVYRIFDNSTTRQLMYVNNSCTSFSVKPFVSEIYEKAFWNATNLEYVTFEGYSGSTYQDYVSIGPLNGSGGNSYNTFKNCPLKEVVLNGPIKRTIWDSIYDNYYVFQNNETLEKVTFGSRISYLYDCMFDGCSNLSTVIAEGEITHVGVHAFRGTKWAKDESEDGVAYLGNYAASYDGESVDVSFNNTTSGIAKGFFSGVTGLGRVVLPTSVAKTSNLMFYGSEVEEVVIPQNINDIAYNTFVYAKVRKLIIEDTDTILNIGCSYDDPCGAFSDASVGTVIIGRPLKEYSKENLLYFSRQSNHPFGESAIGKAIITRDLDLYDWFNGCQVASVEFPQDLSSIGSYAFKYGNDYPSQYHYYYDYTYYYDERYMKSVTIPSTVTSIGYQAFYMSLLDTVTCLATTPPAIDNSSFAYQYDYITLYVPAGCKAIYEATDVWKDFHEIIELAPSGDVNGDGNMTIADVTALIDLLLSGGEMPDGADVNGDGVVSIKDVTELIDMLLNSN